MNRIFPIIKNGDARLLLSESIVLDYRNILQLEIPTADQKTLMFNFIFTQEEGKPGSFSSEIEGHRITLRLVNFINQLGAALTKPIEFGVFVSAEGSLARSK